MSRFGRNSSILLLGILVLPFVVYLANCTRSYRFDDQNNIEAKDINAVATRAAKVMYLDVSFNNGSYQLDDAIIYDSTFTHLPQIKIYGTYGVEVVSKEDDILYEQYTWMNPINGRVRLPFSNEMAFVDFIHRKKDGKYIVSRFDIGEIMEKADYFDR